MIKAWCYWLFIFTNIVRLYAVLTTMWRNSWIKTSTRKSVDWIFLYDIEVVSKINLNCLFPDRKLQFIDIYWAFCEMSNPKFSQSERKFYSLSPLTVGIWTLHIGQQVVSVCFWVYIWSINNVCVHKKS